MRNFDEQEREERQRFPFRIWNHPVTARARAALRRSGFTPAVKRLLFGSEYELALSRAMRRAVRRGDVIWDVGANTGHYATRFAKWTGSQGTVYAFEPAQETAAKLRAATSALPNVRIVQTGLSDREGVAAFIRDDESDGATSRLASPGDAPANASIGITTGDLLLQRGEVAAPDIIKLDVEGQEYEALIGIRDLLASKPPRHIFIEMHFFIFERQGRGNLSADIEKFLQDLRYRVSWVDQSHMRASVLPR